MDTLDPATVRMLQTAYGAGLTSGSRRVEYEAAGLVAPDAARAARSRPALPSGYRVFADGLETVVERPLCQVGP